MSFTYCIKLSNNIFLPKKGVFLSCHHNESICVLKLGLLPHVMQGFLKLLLLPVDKTKEAFKKNVVQGHKIHTKQPFLGDTWGDRVHQQLPAGFRSHCSNFSIQRLREAGIGFPGC